MFEYFPNHYSWNMGLLMAAQLGGELGEIDEACRPLRKELAAHPGAKDRSKGAGRLDQTMVHARQQGRGVRQVATRPPAIRSAPARNICAPASIGSRPSAWQATSLRRSSQCTNRCWPASSAACACAANRSSSSQSHTRARPCRRCSTAHPEAGQGPR